MLSHLQKQTTPEASPLSESTNGPVVSCGYQMKVDPWSSHSHSSSRCPEARGWPSPPFWCLSDFLVALSPAVSFLHQGLSLSPSPGFQNWPSLWETEVSSGDFTSDRNHELRFPICETALRVTTSHVGILWENAANSCLSLPPPLSEPIGFNQKCIINWTMEEWLVEIQELAFRPWLRVKPQIKKIREKERDPLCCLHFFPKLLYNYIASKLYN